MRVVSDYGVSHTRGSSCWAGYLSHHGKSNHPCPVCDIAPLEDSVLGHLLSNHCGELELVQETDLELLLHRLVDLELLLHRLVDLTIFRNLYSLIFLSRNPCHCFVFVCVSCSLWILSINLWISEPSLKVFCCCCCCWTIHAWTGSYAISHPSLVRVWPPETNHTPLPPTENSMLLANSLPCSCIRT